MPPFESTVPLLELMHATVILGGHRALDDVSLSIAPGEHTAIVGPNGSGKSTLLKLLTRHVYPIPGEDDSPRIRVMGKDRWDVSQLRRQMGIVSGDIHQRFVNGNLAGSIVGMDAVLSGFFASHGLWDSQQVGPAMRTAARATLERLGVSHLADRPMDEMSTGEVRRLLIARALVNQPRALVLDEPTTGLDLVARFDFMQTVRDIAGSGTTVILITHHIDEIIPEINRIILLSDGRITTDGPKADTLTSQNISRVFNAPITIESRGNYYSAKRT